MNKQAGYHANEYDVQISRLSLKKTGPFKKINDKDVSLQTCYYFMLKK
jgi:hypothetical protein